MSEIDLTKQKPEVFEQSQPSTTNSIQHFAELSAGSGSQIFKVSKDGIWAGSQYYADAPFKISWAGIASMIGAYLFSDDGSGFQLEITAGKIAFKKSGSQKAYIKTGSDGLSLQLSCSGIVYLTDIAGTPNISFDQNGVISFSGESGKIQWPSGRKITSDGSSITIDGNALATGGMRSTGYTTRVGSTDYSGDNGTFTDADGKTVRVRGGIITNLDE